MKGDQAFFQAFMADVFESISRDYLRHLNEDHAKIITAQRTATGHGNYLVGTQIFFENQQVAEWSAVKNARYAPKLEPDLLDQHNAWYKSFIDFRQEWGRVYQTSRSIVQRAEGWQDIRDMFPDFVLRDHLPELSLHAADRSRLDLYAGRPSQPDYEANRADRLQHWDPKLLDMYERIGSTVNLYVGYKLL